jgi:hypothetical protein
LFGFTLNQETFSKLLSKTVFVRHRCWEFKMATETMPDGMLVVSEEGYSPASYSGVHALVPILIGLAIPPVAIAYLVPEHF